MWLIQSNKHSCAGAVPREDKIEWDDKVFCLIQDFPSYTGLPVLLLNLTIKHCQGHDNSDVTDNFYIKA